MGKRANITSPDSLQDLSSALGKFVSRYLEAMEDLQGEIDRKMEFLQDLYDQRRRNVDRWQEGYDDAEEEIASDYAFTRLEEAEEEFQEVKRLVRRVEEYQEDYQR